MSYERANIGQMTGYTPGEQPAAPDAVKLNTNENPYPPAEPVMRALRETAAEELRRYPPPLADGFRRVAAEAHGLSAEQVVATNGGDELLRLAITTFVEPGRPIGVAEPSYSLYPVLAAIHGSPVVRVDLHDDWSLPEDFAERMNDQGVKLMFLVNPHAPSGRLTDADRLAAIAERLDGLLLIDEAYVDFVNPATGYSALPLLGKLDNVLILRSLSKGYSLAGLRFGYGLGPASLIEPILTKTRDSYNVDAVAQRLATAALTHRDEAAKTHDAVRSERERLAAALTDLGLACSPSQTNFILATAAPSLAGGAGAIYRALKERNIFVRYFDQPRLRDKLRITIGTVEQNDALLTALRELIQPG